MKHIRQFESYRLKKRREDIISESVLQVNDIFKVKVFADIPQSLLNAYVKKVKDTTGKNLRQFFGDMDLAEEITKYILSTYLDSEKIPANALVGGPQSQGQTVQTQSSAQSSQEMAQTQDSQGQDFEDVQKSKVNVQTQSGGQGSAQGGAQGDAQGAQGGAQGAQGGAQGSGQSTQEEEEDELPQ